MKRSLVDWAPVKGRELGAEPLDDSPYPWRVVACLNVWNDRAALEKTLPTWYGAVDAVFAIDGAYSTAGAAGLSTDGTREFLARYPKVQLFDLAGATQYAKRNRYLEAGQAGDLLFVVDADEFVTGADSLRACPFLDVGWVRILSPMYQKPYGQPRLFRWTEGLEYRGRHHWVFRGPDLVAAHQYAGPGFDHRALRLELENRRGLGHSAERSAAKRTHSSAQLAIEAPVVAMPSSRASDTKIGARESLRILQLGRYDAGLASSRLHTAINRTTPHASLWFKEQPGPFGVAGQYSTVKDRPTLTRAAAEADVVHFHLEPMALAAGRLGTRHRVVIHHHGSMLRQAERKMRKAAKERGALVLLSNLELLTYAPEGHFLPNAVPVARYRRLRSAVGPLPWDGSRPFRVAHSPSKPHRKGTEDFALACARLSARGLPVEPLVITGGIPHGEALRLKATADAVFDSFWLGMQCSGLEGAAMGLPVIAGDRTVAERSAQLYGYTPYTFASNAEELEAVLEKLMTDDRWRSSEAERVARHCLTYHDDAAVALRYLDLLDDRFHWRG